MDLYIKYNILYYIYIVYNNIRYLLPTYLFEWRGIEDRVFILDSIRPIYVYNNNNN